VVLVAAALFLESFHGTRDIDPGFRRDGVLLAAYDLTGRTTGDDSNRAFATRVLAGLRALPDVDAAAIATSVPLDIHGLPPRRFSVEGRPQNEASPDRALSNTVTPGYFDVMGIALRAGRDFVDLADTTAPAQVIVNEEFVRRYLDDAEPIGRRLQFGPGTYVIAGVARNSLYESFSETPQPVMYFSYRDRPSRFGEIHLQTRPGNEIALAAEVRRVVRTVDAGLPVYDVRTMAEHIEKNLYLRRIPARMFIVLGPLLLLLAAIGIYAVVAYAVAQRTAEIGIRIALGATPRRVVVHTVAETLRVVVAGTIAGWLLIFMVYTHLVRGGAVSASVFAGVPLLLLLVAAVACWLPARRAARVDPMLALRHE
jgi:predicted permease